MPAFKYWLAAARLRTLPLSISGIVVGSAGAIKAGSFQFSIFCLAIFTTLGFQVLSNFANDYGDGVKGTDKYREGEKRMVASGIISSKQMAKAMIFIAITTLIIALLLIYVAFGSENLIYSSVFFLLGIASIIAAIKYTVGEKAYGYNALGDVFVFLFFGLLGVLGSFFLFTKTLEGFMILPAMTIGLLSAAVLNLNNMRDRFSDAQASKNTLAVVLGETKIKFYHYSLIVLAFVLALGYLWMDQSRFYQFLPLVAFIPLFINLNTVRKNTDIKLLDPELKKVALSTFLFSILMLITNAI